MVQKILQNNTELNEAFVSKLTAKVTTASVQDIEMLRKSVQFLCQSTHSMGKNMDYIQEDIDAMNAEYFDIWRKENIKYQSALIEQATETEADLRPLRSSIKQIEESIREMVDYVLNIE